LIRGTNPPGPPRDTRSGPRQRRRCLVRIGSSSSFTADVGGGGFCVRLMRVLPVRSAVEGSIQVGEQVLPFAGRVAWVELGDRHLNLPGRMGVQLTRIAASFRGLLEGPQARGSAA